MSPMSMSGLQDHRVETGVRGTVYLCADSAIEPDLGNLVRWLDERNFLVVSSFPADVRRDGDALRAVLGACCGAVVVATDRMKEEAWATEIIELTRELQCPVAILERSEAVAACGSKLEGFLDDASRRKHPGVPYAFFAARIHDDFALIRAAVRNAVESVLGIPCVWFDDPRVVSPKRGVRERTQALISGAALFIADLTFGPNNPNIDSPNTAHEIGAALAYERPLILTCQLPRRDLYFLAGDLSTLFWHDEADLQQQMLDWLEPRRALLGRRVWNHGLPTCHATFRPARFMMDPARAYQAPNNRRRG